MTAYKTILSKSIKIPFNKTPSQNIMAEIPDENRNQR